MIQHVDAPLISGAISSSSAYAILQTLPVDATFSTKVILVGLAGVLTTFMTTTAVEYLNKLKRMPERETFDKHVSLLETVNTRLGEFLAGHDQWKHDIERRISDLEDVT